MKTKAFLIAVVLITVLFSACAKTNNNDTAAGNTAAVSNGLSGGGEISETGGIIAENIYRKTQFAVDGYDYASGSVYKDNSFYFLGSFTETDGLTYTTYTDIVKTNESGEITAKKRLSETGSETAESEIIFYQSLTLTQSGEILSRKTTADGEIIVAFNETGENLNETPFFDLGTAQIPDAALGKSGSVNGMQTDTSGNIYLLTHSGVFVFKTATEELLFSVTNENNLSGLWFEKLFVIDGQIAVLSHDTTETETGRIVSEQIRMLDPEKGGYDEIYDISESLGAGSLLQGGGDYPLFNLSGTELLSLDPKSGETAVIVDFMASGYTFYADHLMVLPGGKIASDFSEYDRSLDRSVLRVAVFEKADPNTLSPRKVLTVYTIDYPGEFTEFCAEFNRENTEYLIKIKSYWNEVDGTVDDRITRLNMDLISGDVPDLLHINAKMPYDSYAAKGLFADLNEYLGADETLRSSLNPSALLAMETDGKLYSIARDFGIIGFAARKSTPGVTDKITAETMIELMNRYPDAVLIGDATQSVFVEAVIGYQLGSFIDEKTGEAHFDSPEFIGLLKIAKDLPQNREDLRDGEIIFLPCAVQYFSVFSEYRGIFPDEEIAFFGLPGGDGSGYIMMPSLEIAAMSGGDTDGAFAVIKAYLETNPQDFSNLSIVNSRNEAALLAEMENNEIPETDKAAIMNALENLSDVSRSDTAIMKIIEEETSAYFAGAKSAEECAKLIQNRASTYIAETR
jgi:hypothetical protein